MLALQGLMMPFAVIAAAQSDMGRTNSPATIEPGSVK